MRSRTFLHAGGHRLISNQLYPRWVAQALELVGAKRLGGLMVADLSITMDQSAYSIQRIGMPTVLPHSYQRAELHRQSVARSTSPARTGFSCIDREGHEVREQFLIVISAAHFSIVASDVSRINLFFAALTQVQVPVPLCDEIVRQRRAGRYDERLVGTQPGW